MAKPVELVPLLCLQCGTALPASPSETAWVCANCSQGMYLDEQNGLALLQVNYQSGIPAGRTGKPFWVAEGSVRVERETYSGNNEKDADRFWSQPHLFYVPAYRLPLEDLLKTGARLVSQPLALQSGPAVRFEPPILLRSDVAAVAEFIVVAVEAARKDKLKEIRLSLKLADPVLWILP